MKKLVLPPNENGYQPTMGNGVISTPALKGPPRQRVDFVGAVHRLNLSWTLTQAEMQLLLAFWSYWQRNPQLFLMDLIIDDVVMQEYQVRFDTDSGSLTWSKQGNAWFPSIPVIAIPNLRDEAFDESIIDLWSVGTLPSVLADLDKLVNVALPDALENL